MLFRMLLLFMVPPITSGSAAMIFETSVLLSCNMSLRVMVSIDRMSSLSLRKDKSVLFSLE